GGIRSGLTAPAGQTVSLSCATIRRASSLGDRRPGSGGCRDGVRSDRAIREAHYGHECSSSAGRAKRLLRSNVLAEWPGAGSRDDRGKPVRIFFSDVAVKLAGADTWVNAQ